MEIANRKFFSSLFLLFVLNLLVKPAWIFGIDRPVQNIVGVETYGKYFALFNLSIIFNFLLDIGLTSYLNQALASGKEQASKLFVQAGSIKLLLGLVYTGVLIATGLLTGVNNWLWLMLLAINQFLFSFFLFLRNNITAMQLFKADAWLSVLDKLIMILACGTLIYFPTLFGNISIYLFLLIQLWAISFSIVAAIIIILVKEKRLFEPGHSFNFSLLKQALPFGIIVLVMSTHSRLDGFLLERLHTQGAREAGIYAQAFRLLDTANMAGFLVAGFLLPFVAKNHPEGAGLKSVIRRINIGILSFSAGTIIFCFFYPQWILQKLYHSSDTYAAHIISLCMAALIGYSLVQVYGTLLTATGNIRLLIKLTVPFMLINAILNICFIPSYGGLACCIIAIVTQTLYGLTVTVAARKKLMDV